MDLLVSQKIHAAIQPLINQIQLLEEQVKNMALQIQTLQTLQNKLASQSFTCTQSQTQQTRLEPKVTEKPKTGKQTLVQKVIHPKKDTNVPKTTMKTQVHQVSHNQKKQTRKQISKPKGHSPKESKSNNHELPQKQKLMTEQEKVSEMIEQHKEQVKQESKMNEPQLAVMGEINVIEPNNLNRPQQDISKDIQEEPTVNKTEVFTTDFHQELLIESTQIPNVQQTQSELQAQSLNLKDTDQAKNQFMLPKVEVQNEGVQDHTTMNSGLIKLQNQNVDNCTEKVEKMESNESNQRSNENQIKAEQNQHAEVIAENHSIVKSQKPAAKCQNSKPSAKVSKDIKAVVSPSTKKQTTSKKIAEQNREKMSKSTIVNKQKLENKQRNLPTKDHGIKQKSGGKSVDPAAKKAKAKYPISEKKGPEIILNDSQRPLNQECIEQKPIHKQHEVQLLLEYEEIKVEKAN